MITRYEMQKDFGVDADMVPSKNGEFVRYEDIEAHIREELIKRVAELDNLMALRSAIRELRLDRNNMALSVNYERGPYSLPRWSLSLSGNSDAWKLKEFAEHLERV